MALPTGTKLGPYEIRAPIGAGGMGEVYRAKDTRLGRDVAIKLLPAEFAQDRTRRDRFEQEARAVAALNHPNILALYDIGSENGMSFMVTELVEGESLREAHMTPRKTIEVAAQIADGLAAAHAAGVSHRDLKPENVIVTHDGRAKILDFGLAKVTRALSQDDTTRTQTEAGVVMGTVGYMSPEQVRGVPGDHRTDVFSFGAMLYELLCGKRPFQGETAAEVMTAILKQDPPEMPDSVTGGVRQIVHRCLEKKPEERFQSARDLAFSLRQTTGATVTTSDALPAIQAGPRRKGTWWIAVAALFIGVILGGAIALRWTGDPGIDPVQLSRFASDQATETHPAFSPDGRSVAYLRTLGAIQEIAVQPVGSQAPIIVASATNLGFPIWTADSTRICFSAPSGEFRCVSATGGAAQTIVKDVAGNSAHFTRDGKSLLFLRTVNGKGMLFASSPPGSEPKAIDSATLPNDVGTLLAISNDSTKLLMRAGLQHVWVVPYPRGNPRRLPMPDSISVFTANWFPDDRHVLLSEVISGLTIFRLVIADTESSSQRVITTDTGGIISSALSPDGKQAVFSTGQPDWDIVEYTMDGKRVGPVVASSDNEFSPRWTHAGDRFLYGIGTTGRPTSIWTRAADGSDPRMVVSNINPVGFDPQYSPDGRRIAFSDGSGIQTVSTSGGRSVRVLSLNVRVQQGCWSGDGEWLWYSQAGKGLLKVPSQGGQPELVREGAALLDCSWDGKILFRGGGEQHILAPDGKEVSRKVLVRAAAAPQFGEGGKVFYVLLPDRRNLQVVDTATGNVLRSIEFDISPADQISSFSVNPDGKRVLLETGGLRYDLWIAKGFAQPATGWTRWFRHWEMPPAPKGDAPAETPE